MNKAKVKFSCMSKECRHEWVKRMTETEYQGMFGKTGKTPNCPKCGCANPAYAKTGLSKAFNRVMFNG